MLHRIWIGIALLLFSILTLNTHTVEFEPSRENIDIRVGSIRGREIYSRDEIDSNSRVIIYLFDSLLFDRSCFTRGVGRDDAVPYANDSVIRYGQAVVNDFCDRRLVIDGRRPASPKQYHMIIDVICDNPYCQRRYIFRGSGKVLLNDYPLVETDLLAATVLVHFGELIPNLQKILKSYIVKKN